MKKPKTMSGQKFVVVEIAGGGIEESGRAIVVEFEMLDGTVAPFEFMRSTADTLLSTVQRLLFEAQRAAGQKDKTSALGAIPIKSSMMSFQFEPDGSRGAILVRGTSGPPLSIEILPEDFQALREKLDDIERLMAEARKLKQN